MAGIKIPISVDSKDAVRGIDALSSVMKVGLVSAAALAAAGIAAIGVATIAVIRRMEELQPIADAFEDLTVGIGGSEAVIKSLRVATFGLITDFDLMTATNTALTLGIVNSQDEWAELARGAVLLGRAMGRDALDAINDITVGMGRQSKLILDNLGIIVDTEKAYKDWADQLGKTSSELTDAEKKMAFNTATARALESKLVDLRAASFNLADAWKMAKTFGQNLFDQFVIGISASGALKFGTEELNSVFDAQQTALIAARDAGMAVVRGIGIMVEAFGKAFPFMVGVLADMSLAWLGIERAMLTVELAFARVALKNEDLASSLFDNSEALAAAEAKVNLLAFALVENELAVRQGIQAGDAWVENAEEIGAALQVMGRHIAEVEVSTDDATDANKRQKEVQEEVTETLKKATLEVQAYDRAMSGIPEVLAAAETASVSFAENFVMPTFVPDPGDLPTSFFDDLAGFFETTGGQALGDGLSAGIGAAMGGDSAVDAITEGLKVGLTALAGMIPGFGPIIAMFVGPLVDLIAKLLGDAFKKANALDHVQEQFGIALSEALAAAIDDVVASVGGSFDAAFRLLLGDAIREGTIETKEELDRWLLLVLQTLSSVDEGFLTSTQGVTAMADSFDALIPSVAAAGGSAMDFQMVFSDMITRAVAGGLDMAQVVGTIEDALALMVDSGVEGVAELIVWLETMGVNIDGVALGVTEAAKTWQDAMAVMGVVVAETTEQITRDQIEAIRALGLSAETEAALIKALRREIRQDEKEALATFKQDLRDRNKALGLSREESREVVRATLKAQRTAERKADREATKEAEERADAVISEAERTRDGILATFEDVSVDIPINLVAGSSGDQRKIVNAFATSIIDEIQRRGAF